MAIISRGVILAAVGILATQSACAFTFVPNSAAARQTDRVSLVATAVTSEERAKAAMEAEDAENSGIKTQADQMDLGGRPFPLSMIVGQDNIKQSLLLAAVNNRMGGVVISGGKGTAKSVMARALHQLLPPIEVIKGSAFNIDPEGEFGMDDFLKTELANGGPPLSERETEVIDAPFVQVPLNVMEDRLIGSSDLEESVKTGKSVFSPGLLAKAHRGVLYVDDINLLDEETANILLNVVNDGFVLVEREGISLRYPCKPLVIATFNPDEGELRDHLLDRIAVSLSADAEKLTVEERVSAVDSVVNFSPSGKQGNADATMALEDAISNEDDLKTAIVFAREYIRDLKLAPSQMQYLCEEAIRAGCQGHRAEIFAVEVARAAAAIEGRQVTSEDLRLAVKLAIAPRGTFIQTPMDEDEMMPPPPPPPPPPQMDDQMEDQDQEDQEEEEEQNEPEDEEDDAPDEAPDVPEVPEEFMFDVDATPIDPDLIEFSSRERAEREVDVVLSSLKIVDVTLSQCFLKERLFVLLLMLLFVLPHLTRRLVGNVPLEPSKREEEYSSNSLMYALRRWPERQDLSSFSSSMLLDPWLSTV